MSDCLTVRLIIQTICLVVCMSNHLLDNQVVYFIVQTIYLAALIVCLCT